MTLDPKQIVQIADIPPIPQLLHQIMSMADNPSTTIQKLESLVNQEPAMVTKVLKWVNSALYSFPNKINSVKHAMIILGFSTVRSIASGLALMNAFENIPGINKEQVIGIWRQGLTAAQYAKLLATREPADFQDLVYLACMIQNVGEIVLSQYFGDSYTSWLSDNPFPDVRVEDEKFDTNHTLVGAALLTEWRFSAEVIQTVLGHHNPIAADQPVKELVYLKMANQLSAINWDETEWNADIFPENEITFLKIKPEWLQAQKEAFSQVPKAVKLILDE